MSNRAFRPAFPSAPVDLVATVVGSCQVILAWTECGGGSGGLGFRIERADGQDPRGQFAEIGRVGPHVTAYCDGFVDPRADYRYRVHAWNASGDSPPSNVVEVTTPQVETEPPAD